LRGNPYLERDATPDPNGVQWSTDLDGTARTGKLIKQNGAQRQLDAHHKQKTAYISSPPRRAHL
jgi:hypothetical protein